MRSFAAKTIKVNANPKAAGSSGAAHPIATPNEQTKDVSATTPFFAQSASSITEQAFVDRISESDRWMISLTGAIAAGGLTRALIFDYQLRVIRTASDLIRKSIRISAELPEKQQRDANRGATAMDFGRYDYIDPWPQKTRFLRAAAHRTATNFAQVIFPDETIFESHIARADGNEIKIATQRRDTITPARASITSRSLTMCGIKQS